MKTFEIQMLTDSVMNMHNYARADYGVTCRPKAKSYGLNIHCVCSF